MHDEQLKWAVEGASLRAWPGLEQHFVMGWEARLAGGHTKRANSASPWPPTVMCQERIDACEALYASAGQPAIFKLPDMLDPGVDEVLAARGYTKADPTVVMIRDAAAPRDAGAPPAASMRPADWLASWAACHGAGVPPVLHRMILEMFLDNAIFACRGEPGEPGCCGLAVVDDLPDSRRKGPKLMGLFDVATRHDARRLGHATALVRGLLAAGAARGAELCYLQVVLRNEPAVHLYRSLGFAPLYSYRYRVQQPGGGALASRPAVP